LRAELKRAFFTYGESEEIMIEAEHMGSERVSTDHDGQKIDYSQLSGRARQAKLDVVLMRNMRTTRNNT
jgi:hypothetical protein